MRWEAKNYSGPKEGDRRKRKGFLWLPKTIDGETRWLEFARWREVYRCLSRASKYSYDRWVPEMWLEFDTPRVASPDPPWTPFEGLADE